MIQTYPLPDAPHPDPQVLAKALQVLSQGGIVILPTETVYGLAVRGDDPAALQRLRQCKGRQENQAFTWHAPDARRATLDSPWPHLTGRLTERYWPGPLTLVQPCPEEQAKGELSLIQQDGWIGVRVPAHQGILALLAEAPFPIVATSANPSGSPAATDVVAAQEGLAEAPGLVLDGGSIRGGQDSSVLRLGPAQFELLREGLLSLDNLRNTAGLKIGMICTGNTCRSPMASVLAETLLANTLGGNPESFGFRLSSFGISAMDGIPASDHSCVAVAEQGLSLVDHRSQAATLERIMELDRVYCMTRTHMQGLVASLPPGRGPTVQLLSPEEQDVSDPYGGSLAQYRRTRDAIGSSLEQRLREWV